LDKSVQGESVSNSLSSSLVPTSLDAVDVA
jgi:hypothetical protein